MVFTFETFFSFLKENYEALMACDGLEEWYTETSNGLTGGDDKTSMMNTE